MRPLLLAGPVRALPWILVAILLAGCLAPAQRDQPAARIGEWTATGQVVDLEGRPLADATVASVAATARTDADGWFSVPASGEWEWLTASHPDGTNMTRAAFPDDPRLFRLSPNGTTTLLFGGDTMFARSFYRDGWFQPRLEPGHEAQQIAATMDTMEPLLASADATVLNLETVLGRDLERHPTKEYTFLTSRVAAQVLADAGVDAVTLGNNHAVDALGPGIVSTTKALEDAGILHVGAGMDDDAAWRTVELLPGMRIASCTDRPGVDPFGNFAGPDKPGAARCGEIDAHPADGFTILAQHSGKEYGHWSPPWSQWIADHAAAGGYSLVVGHHSHVAGGIGDVDGMPIAWGLGNLYFDSVVWRSEATVLAEVHVRDGAVTRLFLHPFMRDVTVPEPMPDGAAEPFLRRLAAESGDVVIEDGIMELDLAGRAVTEQWNTTLDAGIHDIPGRADTGQRGWDIAPVASTMTTLLDMPVEDGAWRLDGHGGPHARFALDGAEATLLLEGEGDVQVAYRLHTSLTGDATGDGTVPGSLPLAVHLPAAGAAYVTWQGQATISDVDVVTWDADSPWATHIRLDDTTQVAMDWPRWPGGWGPQAPWVSP